MQGWDLSRVARARPSTTAVKTQLMRSLSVLFLALAACSSESARADAADTTRTATATRADSARPTPSTGPAATATRAPRKHPDGDIVRGLYINRWQVQSPNRMRRFIQIADSTEINALVLDMKDEFGLNFRTTDTLLVRNAGNGGVVPGLAALLDTLRAHDIVSIARLVVFKDSVAARANPQHTIRKADGTAWRDHEGLAWVNPYDTAIWEYNMRVADEMIRLGFDEVQFDYIRFPEPYKSLPPQVFPNANGKSKPDAIAEFLKVACGRINALGGRCTADIFGLVTTVRGPLEIGQEWEKVAPVTDVLLPMVYPSHYPKGAFGVARPNAEPYKIIHTAISKARERNEKLGITKPEAVRPWLQAFQHGQPVYGPKEIEAQKQAVYDAGYEGWILWAPGSKYESFMPGLEKTLEPRAKRIAAAAGAAAN